MKDFKRSRAAYLSALALLSGCGCGPKVEVETPKVEVVEENDTAANTPTDKKIEEETPNEEAPVIITKKVTKELPAGKHPSSIAKDVVSFDRYGNYLETAVVDVTSDHNVHQVTVSATDAKGNTAKKTIEVVSKGNYTAPVEVKKDPITIANENLKKAMEHLAESHFALDLAKSSYDKAISDQQVTQDELKVAKDNFVLKNKDYVEASNVFPSLCLYSFFFSRFYFYLLESESTQAGGAAGRGRSRLPAE